MSLCLYVIMVVIMIQSFCLLRWEHFLLSYGVKDLQNQYFILRVKSVTSACHCIGVKHYSFLGQSDKKQFWFKQILGYIEKK